MARHKLILGLIACGSISMLVGRTLSQTRGGFGTRGGIGRPPIGSGGSGGVSRSRSSKVTEQSKQASLRGAVGASEEQWTAIKPRLEKVRQLQRQASISIATGGGGSGGSQSRGGSRSGSGVRGGAGGSGFAGPMGTGPTTETKRQNSSWMRWQWYRSWGSEPARRNDEKLCESLFNLLKRRNAEPEAIREKMVALAEARERRKQELTEAREELRELTTLDQEARLLALGWLD